MSAENMRDLSGLAGAEIIKIVSQTYFRFLGFFMGLLQLMDLFLGIHRIDRYVKK